jgi:hypothetical protein
MRTTRPALLVVVLTLVAAVAHAASVTTTSDGFGSGRGAVTTCGSMASVTTDFTVTSGQVTEVRFDGLPASCDGASLTATVVNGAAVVATAGPVVVPNNGPGSVKAPVAAPPPATSVSDVHVVMVGP